MNIVDIYENVDRRAEAAKSWSDAEVAKLVQSYLLQITDGDERWTTEHIVYGLGARVLPIVMEVLTERSLRKVLVSETGCDISEEDTFFERACHLFGHQPPAEAAAVVAPFLEAESPNVRANAARVLSLIGTDNCIPGLRQALAEDSVCSSVLHGMIFSVRAGRYSEAFAREIYPDVERVFLSEYFHKGHAGTILLLLDRPRATEFLQSKAVLTFDDLDSLHGALAAFVKAGGTISRDRLLRIISRVDAVKLVSPLGDILANSLRLLGRHRLAKDRRLLEKMIAPRAKRYRRSDSPDFNQHRVRSGAADGLRALYGLEDFAQRIWNAIGNRGYGSLTVRQRQYAAACEFVRSICDMCIDDFAPESTEYCCPKVYFAAPEADHWQDALAGLEAMGEKMASSCLRAWVGDFGKAGPSLNQAERRKQLSALLGGESNPFGGESFYDEVQNELELLATKYVLEHAEDFR